MRAVLSRQMGAHLSRVVRTLCAVDKGRGLYRSLIKDYVTDAVYISGPQLVTSNASRYLSGKRRPLSAFDAIDPSRRILRRVHKVLLAEPQWHTSHRMEVWSARGFSLLATACRTWSPRGQTPILRHCLSWPKLSAISAVTPHPHVYLHLVAGSIVNCGVIRFVRHLLRQIPGPSFMLWDGGNPHRSRRTRAALAEHRPRLRVYRLPAYTPELNADEWLWAWLKQHALRGLCPPDLPVLKTCIRRAIHRLRRRPDIIRSFFQACPLSF